MKKETKEMKKEDGITLISLIVSIILIVILSALTISIAVKNNIIGLATNGIIEYTKAQKDEKELVEETTDTINEVIDKLKEMEPLSPEELIGKYVNYQEFVDIKTYNADAPASEIEPDYKDETTGKYGINYYSSGETTNTAYKNATAPASEDLKWRIFKIVGNEMILISDMPTSYKLMLYGYEGYNNAVKLLNDLCEICYSSEKLGTKARSIKIEDIEELNIFTPTSYKNGTYKNGETYEITMSNNRNIPNICKEELDIEVNGAKGKKLGLSEQDKWYSGYTESNNVSSLLTKYTYYKFSWGSLSVKEEYKDVIIPKEGSYWVASRCGYYRGSYSCLHIFRVDSGSIGANHLIGTDGRGSNDSNSIRPVVSINLSGINLKTKDSDGTVLGKEVTKPILITKKS